METLWEVSWPATVTATVSLLTAAYWMHWRWTHRRMLHLAALLPGPPSYPVIGNSLVFMASPEDLLGVLSRLFHRYGQYVRFWLGADLNVCVRNPADIRLILTTNKVNQKGPSYDFLVPIIGRGILTGGPTWRLHRKIATPSYNKKSIQHYSKVFNEEAEALTKVLMTKDPQKTFDVFCDVLNCTTQTVCQTLMGLSKKDSLNVTRLEEVVMKTQSFYSLAFCQITRWWYQIPLVFWWIGGKSKQKYFINAVNDMTADILDKRRRALAEDGVETLLDADNEAMGIVDRYILSGQLTDQELKEETFTLFTTSQEASAKIASAVLLFLAHLPEWQERVYAEIMDVLGPHDDFVTQQDVKKLPHLDMVYKEVLRYLSIAAMVQRRVGEEISINDGKITLPVGTSLVIPIHELHRDPQYWVDPHKVDPGRFLPENCQNRDPNVFIPFSLGPMDCLGRVYATALIKTLVVRVLRTLILEADGRLEDLEIHVAISVRFAKGYNLRARPRKLGNGRVQA